MAAVTGSFTSTGASETIFLIRKFNVILWGTWTGSVNVEKSYDSGSTWIVVETYTDNQHLIGEEVEKDVLYRLNATSMSGTANYRIGGKGMG